MGPLSPTSPIQQPPHSAGLSYKGLRAAIDPQSIPSPIDAIEIDREQWDDQPFGTLPGGHVPLSTTDYVAIDQGNSSPRFVRMSTWNMPSTSRLASDCEVPLVAIIQPLSDQDPREEPIPLVDTGDIGPARCARCRAYINPWCKWVAGGMRWRCNLCSHETEVAPEYFSNLDANMTRLDHLQRPELNKGTVDFAVPKDYWAPQPQPRIEALYQPVVPTSTSEMRPPEPMRYVFAFDVSQEAMQSDFTRTACLQVLDLLYGYEAQDGTHVDPCFPPQSQVCIMSYDRSIHFYDLLPRGADNPAMLVLPDLDDIFVPMCDGLFVDVRGSQQIITNLLTTLGDGSNRFLETEAALGSALAACLAALAGKGGQVLVFPGVIPTIGLGALTTPEDMSVLIGTEKEKSIFTLQHEAWQELGEQCAEEGIGVNMFFANGRPVDLASISVVSSISGGQLYFHPRFNPVRDGMVLHSELRRLLLRTTGYSCLMKVRCSQGLRITQHYGNFYEPPTSDLTFGTLDADKAISVVLEHTKSLSEGEFAFLQSAVLYTTVSGERRVRVCNLGVQVAGMAGNVFRFADMDAVVCHMVREGIHKMRSQKIAKIQEQLTDKCAAILLAYRKYCATSAPASQLIIPEAFRALPLYTLAIMKSRPLKAQNVVIDVRVYHAHKIMAMGARTTMQHLHPRLMALHDLTMRAAMPDPQTGLIRLPGLMRDSYIFMESYGIYLIDNEELMVLWIGSDASPQLLKDLFEVDDFLHVDSNITQLPVLSTRLSEQLRNIIAHRYAQRGWTPKLSIARQNMDGAELEFADMLVEDKNNAAMSYLDYLCLVHKQINAALTGGSSTNNHRTSFKSAPW
ncbi:beta-sandwich domain of Sec23/24 [Daedalea quercina L-15889]|uniref:Beta-sandwich domain of Sec23/24 n=1 Tax=Daedalea quercina L-15889 TaxID=1314783 RepID=A0A165LKC4_9APHY|nr:beta-sandwich domain of Sec23/24 [Daedalea quercina L-15889]